MIRDLIEQEDKKTNPPPAIVNAVKEYGTDSLSLGSTVQELKRKEARILSIKFGELWKQISLVVII